MKVLSALLLLATTALAGDKLRLNEATQEQLVQVGFTSSQATQIINYRKEQGDFLQVEELLAVPQVSRATLDKVQSQLTVDE